MTAAARAGLLPLKQKTAAATSSHLAFSSGDELAKALQTQQYGRPPALDAVIKDAVDKRELIPLNDFLSARRSIYSKTWVPSPWQVVSWGLRQVGAGGLLGGDKLAVGSFVVLANVEVYLIFKSRPELGLTMLPYTGSCERDCKEGIADEPFLVNTNLFPPTLRV